MSINNSKQKQDEMRSVIRTQYGAIAAAPNSSCCSGDSCCKTATPGPNALAQAIGYDEKSLSYVPEGADMGLSCGNPIAIAALQPGAIVIDLGSGGGFDVFQAGVKVGPSGRVIGVDMTPEMLAKARGNIASYQERTGLDNVEFRLGEIEHLPVADNYIDVALSNCVINLSPDKPQVWREIARVLKPGGSVSVSDLALLKPLPEKVCAMVGALVGCVAGAALVKETRAMLEEAGFSHIVLTPKPEYVQQMQEWRDPLYQKIAQALPDGEQIADYVVSLNIEAKK